MANESAQPYTTENPEVRKVDVEEKTVQGSGSVPVYDADPTRLDLSTDYPETESHAQLDEVVGPDHPAAVIVPPEGRGVLPKLGLGPTPEEQFASGDADETTAVLDGKEVTAKDVDAAAEPAAKKS